RREEVTSDPLQRLTENYFDRERPCLRPGRVVCACDPQAVGSPKSASSASYPRATRACEMASTILLTSSLSWLSRPMVELPALLRMTAKLTPTLSMRADETFARKNVTSFRTARALVTMALLVRR